MKRNERKLVSGEGTSGEDMKGGKIKTDWRDTREKLPPTVLLRRRRNPESERIRLTDVRRRSASFVLRADEWVLHVTRGRFRVAQERMRDESMSDGKHEG